MVLVLSRTYFPDGTNSRLNVRVNLFAPLNCLWKKNETILYSRGKYFIRKRYSNKFKWHLDYEC
jgi:hypothetical protein